MMPDDVEHHKGANVERPIDKRLKVKSPRRDCSTEMLKYETRTSQSHCPEPWGEQTKRDFGHVNVSVSVELTGNTTCSGMLTLASAYNCQVRRPVWAC